MTACSTGQSAAHGLQAAGTQLRAEPQRAVLRTLRPHLIPFTASSLDAAIRNSVTERQTEKEEDCGCVQLLKDTFRTLCFNQ